MCLLLKHKLSYTRTITFIKCQQKLEKKYLYIYLYIKTEHLKPCLIWLRWVYFIMFFSAQLQRRGQQRVTDRVVNAVIASEGGTDKCLWSLREMKVCVKLFHTTETQEKV